MEIFFATDFRNGYWYPDDTESHHISKVMRKTSGSNVFLTNGAGLRISGVLEMKGKEIRIAEFEREEVPETEIFCLAISPVKNAERMEWMVEKLVEIGIKKLIFMETANAEVSRMQARRIHLKAVSAMKQSLRVHLPEIQYEEPFERVLDEAAFEMRYLAHCYSDMGPKFTPDYEGNRAQNGTPSPVLVAIGPEGDFSREEVERAKAAGFEMLDLGPSRLRTETAALVACTLFNQIDVRRSDS